MTTRYHLSSMKQAWRDMYQERTCPGDAIWTDPQHARHVEEHRKRCIRCASRTVETSLPWKELGKALQHHVCSHLLSQLPETGGDQQSPRPGEIWSLKQHLGHWDKRYRYINPPVVLVTEVLEDMGGVGVAQTFHAPALAFEGDVPLNNGFGHAQTWNTYAMRWEDLEHCWGTVSPHVLRQFNQEQNSASLHKEPDEYSVIHFFRELELEIGTYMAMQALPVLIHRHEHPGWPDWMADSQQAREKILTFEPRAQLRDTLPPLVMLATMELPEEMIQKAASPTARQLSFNVIMPGEPDTLLCRTALASIDGLQLSGSTIHVEGWLDDQDLEGELMSWWNPGDAYIEGKVARDPESGYFEIDFDHCSQDDLGRGQLVLLMVQTTLSPHS